MKNAYYHKVGKYYDEEAADYDNRYWKNPVVQQMRQSFREEVKRFRFKTILEVGCGTGIDLVHFGHTHPESEVFGIDISDQMISMAQSKIDADQLTNVQADAILLEDCRSYYNDRRFDMIYVFFGALNTVENLTESARILDDLLAPGGTMVLTFVNKWYLGGVILDTLRFRFGRAFSRFRRVWGGYSPVRNLHSRCYSPAGLRKAFKGFRIVKHHGYSILHPAWYFTGINRKLGRLRRILWNADEWLNRTPLWRFGEYTLFALQKADRTD